MKGPIQRTSVKTEKLNSAVFFVLPAFVFHFLVILFPTIGTFALSFTKWNGIGQPVFIGAENYLRMLNDPLFFKAMGNNVKWIIAFTTVPVFLGLLVSYLITTLKRSQMLLRAVYFIPYIISAAIAGKIWSSYMNPHLGFNAFFKSIGLKELGRTLWLGNQHIALYSIMFVDIWHFWPFVMVMFLGALQQIDVALYESARVEGCNKVQEFFYITIPCIMPTFIFIVITIIMWSFLTFDYVWIMTGGGPGNATEIISSLVYKTSFVKYEVGYSDAICVVQSVLSIAAYAVLQIVKNRGWDV